MSLTSGIFLLFLFILLSSYYLLPKKAQWVVLLAGSLVFYCFAGIGNSLFILATAVTVYFSAKYMEQKADEQKNWLKANKEASKEEKAAYKNKTAQIRRRTLVYTLILNFGILCVFKYTHFVLAQANSLIKFFGGSGFEDTLRFIIPLGISFYTFQTMGYLIDVYWKKVDAQQNFAKLLLYVSFFPQITQGPISDYSQLAPQLYAAHDFSYDKISRGAQRMLCGFAKKIIIAENVAPYVADVFANYGNYSGISVLIGAFFYSIQIYADFSGYMDIVCGLCEMLDIQLTENFSRPYFSKSIAEYWRRWHISLGNWFKTYLYYPIAVSKWNQKLGKKAQSRFGKHIGQTIPASVALVAVWLTTGLWHGASWAYIAWGGVNGLFIIFSLWMEPVYASWKQRLHVREELWAWRAFQTVRTFFLVTLIKVLPEVGSLKNGLGLWKRIFTDFSVPMSFGELLPFVTSRLDFLVVCFGTAVLFITSLIQRKEPVRDWFGRFPAPIRYVVFASLLMVTFYFASSGTAGGFMYAQF